MPKQLVLRVNNGRRKVPTLEVEGRYFACSPFDPHRLAEELKNPAEQVECYDFSPLILRSSCCWSLLRNFFPKI